MFKLVQRFSSPLDFGSDYGWERQVNGNCSPAFWFNPDSVAKSCSTSQSFLNSTGWVVESIPTTSFSITACKSKHSNNSSFPRSRYILIDRHVFRMFTFVHFRSEGIGEFYPITVRKGAGRCSRPRGRRVGPDPHEASGWSPVTESWAPPSEATFPSCFTSMRWVQKVELNTNASVWTSHRLQ